MQRNPLMNRECKIECNYIENAFASCLISTGKTKVICTCSIDHNVPPFRAEKNLSWLTAEYSMLPASTGTRKKRNGLKQDSRGIEIQRLIGRSLRECIDLDSIEGITFLIDCDVIQADGGTRTASITGAYVALHLAIEKLINQGVIDHNPIKHQVAAISTGIVNSELLVDLCYNEDSNADVDFNVVMCGDGNLIEVQGTGEKSNFSLEKLNEIILQSRIAILRLMNIQRDALKKAGVKFLPKLNLIVASTNKNKIFEISTMLDDKYNLFGLDFLGFNDEIIENGNTFQENSIIKSELISKKYNIITIADDSGLSIEYLEGKPGIKSARYGGGKLSSKEKNMLILKQMSEANDRSAHFTCCISLVVPGEKTKTFVGICNGYILESEIGKNGFGYDPIFAYEDGRPFASLTPEEKNKVSHRGIAIKKLGEYLETI